jgi:hypothetical protein
MSNAEFRMSNDAGQSVVRPGENRIKFRIAKFECRMLLSECLATDC